MWLRLMFILIALPSLVKGQQESPPQIGPSPKSFTSPSDNLGFLENSTNLFTGSIQFSLPLTQVPFGNGQYAFNITYSAANIKRISTTWNREAPTTSFGLGWSYDLPRIVADTKGTGTREDDIFYLVEGGVSNPLIFDGMDGSLWKFYPRNYQFWKVRYDPSTERWTIIRDDGTLYVYGEPSNGRKCIQYMVRWGNWIGNTNLNGGTQLAYIWDIAEVKNVIGQKLLFTYIQDEELVGNQNHTKASYLHKITNSLGERIELIYQQKNFNEYDDPHIEQAEPDAYQEKYESKFVSSVNLYDEVGAIISQVKFGYTFRGTGNLTKRLLKTITEVVPTGESITKFEFAYEDRVDDAEVYNTGALTTVTSASGGSITYTHTNTALTSTQQDFLINEITGFAEPKIWIGDDFVVITRRYVPSGTHSDAAQPVRVDVYTWEGGKWIEKNLTSLSDVTLKTESDMKSQNYEFVMGRDFFAFLNRRASTNQFDLNIYRRSQDAPGEWTLTYQQFWSTTDNTKAPYMEVGAEPKLIAGENFLVVTADHATNRHFIYQWKDNAWVVSHEVKNGHKFYYAAGPNYFIAHQDVLLVGTDIIKFYVLDKAGQWNVKTLSSSLSFISSGKSYWHASAGCAVVMASDNNEFIYTWDPTFTTFQKYNTGIAVDDKSFVSFHGSMVLIAFPGESQGGYAFRYNGQNWFSSGFLNYQMNFSLGSFNMFSMGEDFAFRPITVRIPPTGPNYSEYNRGAVKRYDPNISAWLPDWQSEDMYNSLPINYAASFNSFLIDGRVYFKNADGSISPPQTTFMADLSTKFQPTVSPGLDFFASSKTNTLSPWPPPMNCGIVFLRNNQFHSEVETSLVPISGTSYFYNERIYTAVNPGHGHLPPGPQVGTATIVTCLNSISYPSFKDTRVLKLYRKVGEQIFGDISQFVVSKIRSKDGVQENFTSYKYDLNVAATDVSGFVPQFNKVEVYPGVIDPAVGPYPLGQKTHYFINGLPHSAIFSNDVNATFSGHLLSKPKKFLGTNYRTRFIDPSIVATEKAVLIEETLFTVFSKQNGFFIRPLRSKKIDLQMNRSATQEFTYDVQFGHLLSEKSYVQQVITGVKSQELTNTYKYWWESYDPTRVLNIFNPLIQTTTSNGSTIIASSVSRFKSYTINGQSVSLPYDGFVWKKSGSSTFTNWDPNSTPSADWEITEKTTVVDNTTGLPLEQQGLAGELLSNILDFKKRNVTASVSNANYDQIAFTSFEDASLGNFASLGNGLVSSTDYKTGSSHLRLGTVGISRTGLQAAKTYNVSFWVKSSGGSFTADGFPHVNNLNTTNAWILQEYTVTGLTSIVIKRTSPSIDVLIDEVRIYPKEGRMNSSTYHRLFGITSRTDENNQSMYFEYDAFGRTTLTRNEDRNIVSSREYNLKKR